MSELNDNNSYFCTECSSFIEVLFINEKNLNMEFKCIDGNHENIIIVCN